MTNLLNFAMGSVLCVAFCSPAGATVVIPVWSMGQDFLVASINKTVTNGSNGVRKEFVNSQKYQMGLVALAEKASGTLIAANINAVSAKPISDLVEVNRLEAVDWQSGQLATLVALGASFENYIDTISTDIKKIQAESKETTHRYKCYVYSTAKEPAPLDSATSNVNPPSYTTATTSSNAFTTNLLSALKMSNGGGPPSLPSTSSAEPSNFFDQSNQACVRLEHLALKKNEIRQKYSVLQSALFAALAVVNVSRPTTVGQIAEHQIRVDVADEIQLHSANIAQTALNLADKSQQLNTDIMKRASFLASNGLTGMQSVLTTQIARQLFKTGVGGLISTGVIGLGGTYR